MNLCWNNLRMFLWMSFLTGIAYPSLITVIAQLTMYQKANGNFININGKTIGALLIGQKFESDKYIWPRPSAVDYNPLPSGGSNLGPTSAVLKKVVEDRKAKILKVYNLTEKDKIPSELLFASGSGLDPHISPATARFQISRVIKARGWDEAVYNEKITKLIHDLTEHRRFHLFGPPCVNVLKLNLALDELR